MPYNTQLSRKSKAKAARSVSPVLNRTNPDVWPRVHMHDGTAVTYHLYLLRDKKNKSWKKPAVLAALQDAITNASFLNQLLPFVWNVRRHRHCYVKLAATEDHSHRSTTDFRVHYTGRVYDTATFKNHKRPIGGFHAFGRIVEGQEKEGKGDSLDQDRSPPVPSFTTKLCEKSRRREFSDFEYELLTV